MTGPHRAGVPGGVLRVELLRAELRRVSTTRTAAGVLVVAALLAAAAGAVVTVATTLAARADLASVGVAVPPLQGLAASFATQTVTAPAVFLGVVGATSELRHRTAALTALTAPGPGPVLLARAVVHAGLGALLGIIVVVASTVAATGAAVVLGGGAVLPPLLALAGCLAADVLAVTLWTLFGTALGALLGHQVGAVLTGVAAVWFVSPLLAAVGSTVGRSGEPAVLAPTEAALALTRRRPLEQLGRTLVDQVPAITVPEDGRWWLGAVVLLGWVVVIGSAGWARTRRRDVP